MEDKQDPVATDSERRFLSMKHIFSHLTDNDKEQLLGSLETVCKILGKIS